MAIFLAAMASVFVGSGEYVSSGATRRVRPEQVTVGFFVMGVAVSPLLVLVDPGRLDAGDLVLGAVAGLGNGLGLMFLHRAYSVSSVGVAAPLSGVIMAVVPVLMGTTTGDGRPSAVAAAGIGTGLGAVALTSLSPQRGGDLRRGIPFAVLAGLGYAMTLTAIGSTDETSGLWPTVPQRLVALAVVFGFARSRTREVLPPRGERSGPFISGLLGSAGMAAFTAGAQRGSLAPVAVAGSQFAAVAVILAFVLRGERVWWWQAVGLAAAVTAVALIAAGSA